MQYRAGIFNTVYCKSTLEEVKKSESSLTVKQRIIASSAAASVTALCTICIRENEPVLLVGETGVGKTSVIQALASNLNVTLKVVNLSPTSDSNELLEGYKPTSIGSLIEPFTQFYYDVFKSNLNSEQNRKFLNSLENCLNNGRYHDYLSLVEKTATKVLFAKSSNDPRWAEVAVRARKIREGIDKKAIPFALTRGAVLEAVQKGEWLLVDEINLAPPDCLDAIVCAITSQAHPNFRLFACMNPATDAGKKATSYEHTHKACSN